MKNIGTINYTKIPFNDKLKDMYDEIHINHIDIIDKLSYLNLAKVANKQMRDIFDDYFDYKLQKCDYFALITGLVSDYEDYDKWDDVMDFFDDIKIEQQIYDYDEDNNIQGDASGNIIKSNCICSKEITKIFKLYRFREVKLIIGSSCFKKHIIKFNKSHKLYKKYLKENKKYTEYNNKIKELKENFIFCNSCNKYKIPKKDSWKSKCSKCFAKSNSINNNVCLIDINSF